MPDPHQLLSSESSSLHNYFRVGIVHFMAFPTAAQKQGGILETVLQVLEDDFFSAIEVTSIKDPGERKETVQALESSGFAIGFGAQPILLGNKADLNSLDESKRRHAIDLLKSAVDEAYEMKATRFALLSGPHPGAEKESEAIQALIASLTEVCKYARSKGDLQMVLETFDRDIDKKCLIGPNALAVQITNEVRKADPRFGLLVDLSHFPLQHESTRDALQTTRHHLVHAHMGNCYMKDTENRAYGDLHPRFGYPGSENDVPQLTEYLQELHRIGYLVQGGSQIVAFEVKPLPGELPKVILAQSKRTLLSAWRKVSLRQD